MIQARKKRNSPADSSSGGRKSGIKPATKSQLSSPSHTHPSVLPKTDSSHIPWKVMSKEDVNKNIQKEIERRKDIEQGKIPSSKGVIEAKQQKQADISSSQTLLSTIDKSLVSWKRFHPDTALGGISLVGSYLGTRLPPSLGVPEVAFLGRSNVGKSSLLNKLCTSTSMTHVASSSSMSSSDSIQLARVGKTPGATASVNLYSLLARDKRAGGSAGNPKPLLGFVDLPGFGFAKLSKEVKESVEIAAERYLNKRSKKELALCILLIDIRRIPSEEDRAVLAALYDLGAPLLVVATKVDKLSSNELSTSLEAVRTGLGLPEGQPFYVSSTTGVGIRELWQIILDACEDRVSEIRDTLQNGEALLQENSESIGVGDENMYDTIPLDAEGNFIHEVEYEMETGYDWIQKFDSTTNRNEKIKRSDRDSGKTSFRLKDLKQRTKDMMTRGEI